MKCPVCDCEHLVYTEHRPTNVLPWFNVVFILIMIFLNRSIFLVDKVFFNIQIATIVICFIYKVVCFFLRPKSRTKATCPECGWYLINK